MSNGLLLWADDEIELLRAHLMFLEKKGYEKSPRKVLGAEHAQEKEEGKVG